jgi:hypothetical protein
MDIFEKLAEFSNETFSALKWIFLFISCVTFFALPFKMKLEYEFNKTGDIDFYSGELYLNAIGDVVSGCDWSYKSQKKYRFGNVMNKNWLENISNSELYIAS